MNVSALKNKSQNSPVLIVDKVGMIGEALARHFSKDYLVVLLSEKLFSKDNSNLLHVPFRKKIPEVPDNEYSKIIIVDDGTNVVRESAFSFVDKALENNAPLYFIGSIRNVDVEHSDEVAKSYKNAKVLLFGDLFDNGLVFDKNSAINQFILSVRSQGKIRVAGDGLSLSFPITFIDTIKLIIKATELSLDQQVILLFSANPITDIALAGIFKKAKPSISIDFIKEKKIRKTYIPKGALHAIDKYALDEKIKNLNLGKNNKEEAHHEEKQKKQRKIPLASFLLTIIFIAVLPLTTTYTLIFTGNYFFNNFYSSLKQGSIEKAISVSEQSYFVFNLSEKTFFVLNKELSVLGLKSIATNLDNKIAAGKYLSIAGSEISKAIVGFKDVRDGATRSPKEIFITSSNQFKNGMYFFEKAQSVSDLPINIKNQIKNLEPTSDFLSNSQDTALDLFGFNKEKKYLVVELDKNNIKPAGGSVKSAKIILIKNGRVVSDKSVSLDEISKYLGPTIEVPFYAKRYGQIEDSSVKNSVYKIGFWQNAKDMADIYSFAKSEALDGVVGISSDRLEGLQNTSFVNLMLMVGEGVIKKDIMLATISLDAERVLESQNLVGSILDNRLNSKAVINDYFGLVESSFDNNSSNISRTVSKSLKVDSTGKLESSVTTVFKNSGESSSKIYFQLLMPNKSNVSQIKIDDSVQKIIPTIVNPTVFSSKSFKSPKGLEVYQYNESGKEIAGFLIEIPANGIKSITITYGLPDLIQSADNSFVYSLNLYKQPLLSEYSLGLSFGLPSGYRVINSSENIDFNLDEDKSFKVTISKK